MSNRYGMWVSYKLNSLVIFPIQSLSLVFLFQTLLLTQSVTCMSRHGPSAYCACCLKPFGDTSVDLQTVCLPLYLVCESCLFRSWLIILFQITTCPPDLTTYWVSVVLTLDFYSLTFFNPLLYSSFLYFWLN